MSKVGPSKYRKVEGQISSFLLSQLAPIFPRSFLFFSILHLHLFESLRSFFSTSVCLNTVATPVTLPHFNEIYGNIDFSHHRYSPSTALTPGSAHFQGSISFHQQAYQNASRQHLLSPDKEQQLPLPCQPFLPTPDRLQSLYKIRTQDEQNFQGQLNTIQSQTEGGESSKKPNTDSDYGAPQMARPFQLQDFQYPSAHPSTSRFEASGMIHIPPLHPDQIRAYYGYPAGNTGNPGLGIASSERPLSSSSQINHERPPGNPPLNNDGAPSASTSAFPDLPNAGEYDYSQQQVHLPIFHQQNEPPLNIFRPPHFPPETYNGNRRRQSVLQSWNYGAGSTLAKSPSFTSPYGQAQIHIPPRPTATPSVIPTRVYNPYTATSPGGPPETHDAQRMVDQIDLPTLYHALRYWKSIQRDPHQNLDSRHLAAMNCETLENRIKVVETTKRESSIFSQDQNYGALDTRSNYAGPSNQERSTVFYPTFPTTGRIRTQSSSIVNSPAKDSTSPLVKRSASYTSLPGTSQALTHSQNLRTEGKDPNMNIEPSISPRLSLAEMSTRSKKQGLPVKVELPTSMSRSVSPVATKAPPRKRVSKPSNPAKRVSATLSPAITSENGEPCGSTSRLDLVSIGAETPDPSTMTESSTSAADSPQGSVSGAGGQKKTTRGTSAGKRKNGSPGPIPSDGDGIYKVGDLIFDNDWKRDKDHHVPMKTYIGPITPSNITYTWTESECVAERRLVHVTSTIDIDEKLVHVQFATLDVANYTAEVDTAPYSQGSVVSLIFAEIFPRIPGQNQKPEEIYWISYWDVLKVCEVAIDLVNRTLHFKRTQDFKAR